MLERKLFCLSLENFLLENGNAAPGISNVIRALGKQHLFVVTSIYSDHNARELLQQAGLYPLLTNVFGGLGHLKGKSYNPIAKHYLYVQPENHMVAISSSQTDVPADIDMPFLFLPVPAQKRADTFMAGVSYLEKKVSRGYKMEIKVFDVGNDVRIAECVTPNV